MTTGSKPLDRGALYYPYIHVRDENWLKATLLCFPYIDRMVPKGYEVNDSVTAAYFTEHKGRHGRSMLGRRDLDDPATEHARSVLLDKLQEDVSTTDLLARFSREAAKKSYKDGDSAFQIHQYKFGSNLLAFLSSHKLTWEPERPVRGNARWWAVHPVLGEAIMSTNAVALAQAHDLEIVTSDGPIHQALLGRNAEEVYDVVVRERAFGLPRTDLQKVNDLMQFVIVSEFDMQKLSVGDVSELNRLRSDVSSLKASLLAQVEDVGAVPDREVWEDLLSVRAKEIVEEWGSRSALLSGFLRPQSTDLGDEFKDFLKEVAPSVVGGGGTTAVVAAFVGALPGLAVGVIFGAVKFMMNRREGQRPYRLLSHLSQKGARSLHVLQASPV